MKKKQTVRNEEKIVVALRGRCRTRVNTCAISSNGQCNISITHHGVRNSDKFPSFSSRSISRQCGLNNFPSFPPFLLQAAAYSHCARLPGGCVQLDKNGTASLPSEHPERRRPVASAPGCAHAATEDRKAANSGRCKSGIEELSWKHGPPPGLRYR